MKHAPHLLLLPLVAALLAGGCRTPSKPTEVDTLGETTGEHAGWVGSQQQTGIDLAEFGSDASELGGFNAPLDSGAALDDGGVRGLLPSIYFGFDEAAIIATERAKVEQAAEYLRSNPGATLLVEGHCDWRGTSEYNLALGDRRSSTIKQYLAQLAIDESRISVLSKGDLDATPNGSDDEMREDRRADLVIVQN